MSLNNITNNDLTVSPTMPSILTETQDNLRYDLGSPDDTQYFDSREGLVNFVKDWAIGHGFCITIDNGSNKEKVRLKCDIGGVYRDRGNKGKRINTSSRLIGCNYRLTGRYSSKIQKWHICITFAFHTHEACPQNQMISRSQARARSIKPKLGSIENLVSTVEPRKIATSLRREDPEVMLLSRDISNLRSKKIRDVLDGRTPIQALLDSLVKENVPHRIKVDVENHLTHLFFAFPDAIRMTRLYHSILVIDSTYKTNKYRMPMIHAVGVSSTYQTFTSFICFTKSETTDDYNWAMETAQFLFGGLHVEVIMTDNDLALMNAIRVNFPESHNLLCNWHIWKNIMAKHRGSFASKEEWDVWENSWKKVIQQATSEGFNEAWSALISISPPELVCYVERQWIPHKERFATPWTNNYRHLGHSTSSRAEGAHAKVKAYLEVSTAHLFTVFERLKDSHQSDITEISARIGQQQQKIGRRLRGRIFEKVNLKISYKALHLIADFIDAINKEESQHVACTGIFQRVWGMPCRHKIKSYLSLNKHLDISDFCSHWYLSNYSSITALGSINIMEDEESISTILAELNENITTWDTHQQFAARSQLKRIRDIGITGGYAAMSTGIQEPLTMRPKGRPPGAFNRSNTIGVAGRKRIAAESSTQRELSEFEHAARNAGDTVRPRKRLRGPRLCSECSGQGHDKRNCPNRIVAVDEEDEVERIPAEKSL